MTLTWMTLDEWGFSAARYLLEALWQSSLVFAAVAALNVPLRRYTPRARRVLWLTALLIAPALPLLSTLAKPAGLPQQSVAALPVYAPLSMNVDYTPAPAYVHNVVAPALRLETPAPDPLDYPWALALLAYAAGGVFFLTWTLLGHARIHLWMRSGAAAPDAEVVEPFRRAAARLNVRRPVRVVTTDRVPAPITAGIVRPTVLLPHGIAETLTPDDLYAVALHEMVHVQQHEPLILTLASLVRSVLYFHPLVWIACRRLAVLAEHTADDAVLEVTGAPTAYAKLLTTFAERLPLRTPSTEGAAGLVFCKSAFLKRVEAILGDRKRIRELTRIALACTVVATLVSLTAALALPLGAKEAEHKQESSDSDPHNDSVNSALPSSPRRELIRQAFDARFFGKGFAHFVLEQDLRWSDIPYLLEIAESDRYVGPIKKPDGSVVPMFLPTNEASSQTLTAGVEGVLALWYVEGLRGGVELSNTASRQGSQWKTNFFPPLNPIIRVGSRADVLGAYKKWWETVKDMPPVEAAKIIPLAGTPLRWDGGAQGNPADSTPDKNDLFAKVSHEATTVETSPTWTLLKGNVKCAFDSTTVAANEGVIDKSQKKLTFTGAVTVTTKDAGVVHADKCVIDEDYKARFSGNVSFESDSLGKATTTSLTQDLRTGEIHMGGASEGRMPPKSAGRSTEDSVRIHPNVLEGSILLEGAFQLNRDIRVPLNLASQVNWNTLDIDSFRAARTETGYVATFHTSYFSSPKSAWKIAIRLKDDMEKEAATGEELVANSGAPALSPGFPFRDIKNVVVPLVGDASAIEHATQFVVRIAKVDDTPSPSPASTAVSPADAIAVPASAVAPVDGDVSPARTFLLTAAKLLTNATSQGTSMTLDVRSTTEYRGAMRGNSAAPPESFTTAVQYMRSGDSIFVTTDMFPVELRDDTGKTRQAHDKRRYAWTKDNEWWQYGESLDGLGRTLQITSDRGQRDAFVNNGLRGNEAFGYVPHEQGLIYDSLLRQDLSRASLSTEEVNGKTCTHVSSANANGRFDLWVDSESGYLPRKLLIHKDADSLMYNSKALKDTLSMPTDLDEIYNWFKSNSKRKPGDAFENAGQSLDYLLENVEISKVGSSFFITRADSTEALTFEGKREMTTKTRIEARDIEIGGKASLPESYMLYDLPRNTEVIYLDKARNGNKRYTSSTLPRSKKTDALAGP